MRDAEIYDQALDSLPLPIRVLNWASRSGVCTVRDLVCLSPSELAREVTVGPGSVARTRAIIESQVGQTWNDPAGTLVGFPGTERPTLSGDTVWDVLLDQLPQELLLLEVSSFTLPTRIRQFCDARGIVTVAELVEVPRNQLVQVLNVGDEPVEDTRLILLDLALRPEAEPAHESALAALKYRIARLEPAARMIITRRAGLLGESQTLAEIGEILGVSRERVRQIEMEGIAQLRRSLPWLKLFKARLAHIAEQVSTTAEELEQDPWWAELIRIEELFLFFLERILKAGIHVVVVGDKRLLTTLRQEAIDDLWRTTLEATRQMKYPSSETEIDRWLEESLAAHGAGVMAAFRLRLDGFLRWSSTGIEGNRLADSFGRTDSLAMLAYLEAQDEPVTVASLWNAVGKCALSDEVLYFARGVVGVKKHFPEFEQWRTVVPSACVQIMEEAGPERQWTVAELLEALLETGSVPDSFNQWHVASLLRSCHEVHYLGRLRVALPTDGGVARSVLVQTICDALEHAGRPLSIAHVREAMRKHTDVNTASLTRALNDPMFIETEPEVWGLMSRDFPGGPSKAEELRDFIADGLEIRQHGLTFEQASERLDADGAFNDVRPCLRKSALRADSRLRVTPHGDVGLSLWTDVRVPTLANVIENALSLSDGRAVNEGAMRETAESGSLSPTDNTLSVIVDSRFDAQASAPNASALQPPAQPDEDERFDQPPLRLTREQVLSLLSAFSAPKNPELNETLAGEVANQIACMVARPSDGELVLIEKYIDHQILALQGSDIDWLRGLGETVYALRQLQLLERDGEVELDEQTLRHVRASLFYLVNRDDVIPDSTPDIGYLDDAHAVSFCVGHIVVSMSRIECVTAPAELEDLETDKVMYAFRRAAQQTCPCPENDLLRAVSKRLGYDRLGSRIRERLKGHLRAAIRRHIIVRDGTELFLETPNFSSYTRDALLGFLPSVMRRGREYERDEVIEALAKYLGFQRVTENVIESVGSVFNSAIRRGSLGYRGSKVWRQK